MELKLIRRLYTGRSTIGELRIGEAFQCFTLEDIVRSAGSPKVPGATAIPSGRYEVILNHSQRFQQLMPLLLNVPGFQGIRIHSGNTDKDTEGCILVGRAKGLDMVLESRAAYADLFTKLLSASVVGKVFIQIVDTI